MGKLKEYYMFPDSPDRTDAIQQQLETWWSAKIPGRKRYAKINQYMIIEDRVEEVREVVVHSFQMGDVEDPDLYAAQPLWEWQESPAGQWVMEHAIEPPEWHRMADPMSYGYTYRIMAKLSGPALTEFLLRHK